ncbi:MAG: RidA family protein [Allosphingosinicella sp.]|uniref:RidA family protein n=1 Tax=Allosphingosinicella sp. TaxID=2823234 RepID=UPI0039364F00
MTSRQAFHLRPEGERAFGYAQAVKAGNLIHIAGTLSVDDAFTPLHAGDLEAQLRTIYASVRETLAQFGASLGNVVRETIFVTDMEAFLAANRARIEVYEGWFPATTAVEVRRLAFAECMVEIEITASL